jgi:signal transduction histidine kinase/ActR/RegA family two-component response regulator
VLGVNILIQLSFRNYIPMSLFLAPTVVAAWFAGRSVGLFVMLIGLFIEVIFYSSVHWNESKIDLIRITVYLVQGTILSLVFGRAHRLYKNVLLEREIAKSANDSKSLFLANISHEIRTPLASVLGYAELLKDSRLTPEQVKNYSTIIERTGNNLLQLINDILDLSKIEAGKLEVDVITFSLFNLLEEVKSTLQLWTEQKNINFIFNIDENVSEYIDGDPKRIRQILMNLLGNSVKFTDHGFVMLHCSAHDSELYFTVQDSGIGIMDCQKSRLFNNFCQADESIQRKYQGTGLGLALSRQLAQHLDGDITLVDSQFGCGSTFLFRVPYRASTEFQIAGGLQNTMLTSENTQLRQKKVLLVEDSLDNQFLINKILSDWGCEVVLASNGRQALEVVKMKMFDLILMDMHMPIMDGYTACTKLAEECCKIPIVALTASAMKEDRQRCLDVGCCDYVSKPIEKKQLYQTILRNLTDFPGVSRI